jgi:hypothetical protein
LLILNFLSRKLLLRSRYAQWIVHFAQNCPENFWQFHSNKNGTDFSIL